MKTEVVEGSNLVFRWNHEETIENERRYGLSLHEASTAFADADARIVPARGRDADRHLICGRTEHGHMVVVTFRERYDQIWLFAAWPLGWTPPQQAGRPPTLMYLPRDFAAGVLSPYARRYQALPVVRPPQPPFWEYWADALLHLVSGGR